MAPLLCLNCHKTYDSSILHFCSKGESIPRVVNRNSRVEANADNVDSLRQESTHGRCFQNNETSVVTEYVVKPEISNVYSFYNPLNYGNDKPTFSSQDCTRRGENNKLMAIDLEQGHIKDWTVDDQNDQTLIYRNELGTIDYNVAMRHSFPNSEIQSSFDGLPGMDSQLTIDEDNLCISGIPNLSNNTPDFATASEAINYLSACEFPMLDKLKIVEMWTTTQNNDSKFTNNILENRHSYDISGMSKDASVINEEKVQCKHELLTGHELDTKMEVDNIQSTEMDSKFYQYGQNTQTIFIKDELDRISNINCTEAETSRNLIHSNILTRETPLQTGSVNDKLKMIKTRAELFPHKSTVSTEYKMRFNDMDTGGSPENSAVIRSVCSEKSNSVDYYPVANPQTIPSSSSMQLNERNSLEVFNKFQSNTSSERNSGVDTKKKCFVCKFCQKGYTHKGNFQRHLLGCKGKRFVCKFCQKGFTYKCHFERHLLVHEEVKPYICGICGKSFTQKVNLETHMRVHTGERSFTCDICYKKFAYKSSLNTHMSIHNRENR